RGAGQGRGPGAVERAPAQHPRQGADDLRGRCALLRPARCAGPAAGGRGRAGTHHRQTAGGQAGRCRRAQGPAPGARAMALHDHRRTTMRNAILLIGIGLAAGAWAQRPSPAPPQHRSVLVKGGTVHVGDGKTYTEGAVGFRAGTLDFVGYGYAVQAAYDTVVDATGMHVYPGFILPDATLGLVEIDAVRASVDEHETGQMEPE